MAGVGRRTLYRKSVTDEYLNSTPEPGENEEICMVQGPRGSNILEIMLASGEQALAILPTKFRKLIWVKRGDYLITSTSAGDFETSAGEAGKVRHRVEHILNKDQIKHLKNKGLWPDAPVFCAPVNGKDPRENWGDAIAKTPAAGAGAGADATNSGHDDSRLEESAAKVGRSSRDVGDSSGMASAQEGGASEGIGEEQGGVGEDEEEEEEEEDDMSDLYVNNNRAAMMQLRTDHDDDEEDSDSDDDSDG